jgi:hypothetical protein
MPVAFNILALVTICVTSALYWVVVERSWLFEYPWVDIPLHLLGGLAIGFWACAVAARLVFSPRGALLFSLASFAVLGSLWELFEYIFDIAGAGSWIADTFGDLVVGALGAILPVGAYSYLYRWPKQ